MDVSEFIDKLPNIFDWYLNLPPQKRSQLNSIVITSLILTGTYYNDKQHRENYSALVRRYDINNDARTADKEKYVKSLEFYTNKAIEINNNIIEQREKRQELETRQELEIKKEEK